MLTSSDVDRLHSAVVRTVDGHAVGRVHAVFTDDDGRPVLLGVRGGVLGLTESFVPATGAVLTGREVLVLAHHRALQQAPQITGEPTEDELAALLAHWDARLVYGLDPEPAAVPA